MAIDAAHRASIYEKLRPLLGDEDANVLMSEFPSTDADQLVTREFLLAESADLRTEMRTEIAQLRTEMRTEIAQLRTEMRTEIAQLRTEMAEMRSALTLRIGSAIAASTALLAAIGIFT